MTLHSDWFDIELVLAHSRLNGRIRHRAATCEESAAARTLTGRHRLRLENECMRMLRDACKLTAHTVEGHKARAGTLALMRSLGEAAHEAFVPPLTSALLRDLLEPPKSEPVGDDEDMRLEEACSTFADLEASMCEYCAAQGAPLCDDRRWSSQIYALRTRQESLLQEIIARPAKGDRGTRAQLRIIALTGGSRRPSDRLIAQATNYHDIFTLLCLRDLLTRERRS